MDEAEARRKRLKALRAEADESESASTGAGKLANPLVDAPAAQSSASGFSFYSDPVGALRGSRASTTMQPKQAPGPPAGSRPPGYHTGSPGRPLNQPLTPGVQRPLAPAGRHPGAPGMQGMHHPHMHMQWQQRAAMQQPVYGMKAQWHGGQGYPPPQAQHILSPRPPPQPWGHLPHAPHPAHLAGMKAQAGRGRGHGRGSHGEQRGCGDSGRGGGQQQGGRGRGREDTFNVGAYYQPSMVEDPWRQLRQRKQQQKPDAAARADGEAKGTGGRQQQQHQQSIEPVGEAKSADAGELSDSRLDTEGALDRPWH